MFPRPPIRRTRSGQYALSLGPAERSLLASLPAQMRSVLEDPDDPSLRRLFPPAYSSPDDRERQEEYRRLMNEELLARHAEALEVLESTAGAEELTAEQLDGWARALNSVRLLLGTRLDVTEDDDPRSAGDPEHGLYYYLGYLQESAVAALMGGR